MATGSRELYRSSNGDRWLLVRDADADRADADRLFVRHEANAASGGHRAEIGIAAFLAGGLGPEQQALLRLIGTLVEPDD
ncbi:hypothetical protein [Azospirillum thermophilum]|uniref:Uncharacterized protein n=1 Tax=Azospirillum thermophilum TaxID=2202148 RepID=A0A2S2CZ06_9PROT|nr:hypothetical protein [Azospirillum thermophilum]AWK89709.1 hypothetical protein DEW08_27385 [Azospirillum thermophilum]